MTERKVIETLLTSGLINVSELSRQLHSDESEARRKYLSRRMKRSRLSKENIQGIIMILEQNKLTIKI